MTNITASFNEEQSVSFSDSGNVLTSKSKLYPRNENVYFLFIFSVYHKDLFVFVPVVFTESLNSFYSIHPAR